MEVVAGLVVIFVVWLIWKAIKKAAEPKTPEAAELLQQLNYVGHMSGTQFEYYVASVFRTMGYNATVQGGAGDQGVDIIVAGNGQLRAIQCKNYANPVGNAPVQQVYAGARHHRCDVAMVVAPNGYTKGAVSLAKSVGVELADANDIRRWIRQIEPMTEAGTEPTPEPTPEPTAQAWDTPTRKRTQPSSSTKVSSTTAADLKRIKEKTNKMHTSRRLPDPAPPRPEDSEHTIVVGSASRLTETVTFSADRYGTALINGGNDEGGIDANFYELPDGRWRIHVFKDGVSMLEPSNMLELMEMGQTSGFEYGSWSVDEFLANEAYGEWFKVYMREVADRD